MSRSINRRGIVVLVTVGALLLAAFAVTSQAQAATYYACVKKNGTARVFTKKPKCKKGETALSWSNVGPAGKNGANGANGTNGANGKNGTNGTNGTNGAEGKEGMPGQPQKAVKFSSTLEAPFLSNTTASLFSLAGVSVRLNCVNALIANVTNLEATGPAGAVAVSGMSSSKVNNKEATEAFQQPVYNVGLSSADTAFASLVTNGKAPLGNVGHVNATIVTGGAVILVDSFIEVNEDPEACKAIGTALTVPL
ncbi:MAG TPA: hypothetical protein VK707_04295 [Solirubrobacteraceae bacterium]|jgi:hypothetical protein|nr:hypothetical protein [Solirubrobacteraceae bacterium]